MKKKQIQKRLAAITERVKALAAGTEQSDAGELTRLEAEFETLSAQLDSLSDDAGDVLARMNASDVPGPRITGGTLASDGTKTGGFASLGEMAAAIAVSDRARNPQHLDKRLMALSGNNTQVGKEGGYLVPPQFASELLRLMQGDGSLAARCRPLTSSGGDYEQPVDVDEPWSSSGIQVGYWPELSTKTPGKAAVELLEMKTEEAGALVKASNRVLRDAAALESLILSQVPERLRSFVNGEILRGDGVGRHFHGLLTSNPAKFTVSATGGQGAGTITWKNVRDMRARIPSWLRGSYVWLVHPEAVVALDGLVDDNDNALFIPAGGLSDAPYDQLYGRPIIESEDCSALGTEGDIIAVSLSEYGYLTRAGMGMQVEQSIHMYFDQNASAFRFVTEVGGGPLWPRQGARKQGAGKFSPYVTLSGSRS